MNHSSATVPGGTPAHIPPEKWRDYEIESDVKFDVYGFGIMLWELYTDRKPFRLCEPGKRSRVT